MNMVTTRSPLPPHPTFLRALVHTLQDVSRGGRGSQRATHWMVGRVSVCTDDFQKHLTHFPLTGFLSSVDFHPRVYREALHAMQQVLPNVPVSTSGQWSRSLQTLI